jgi:hypothetical protein
MMSDVYDLKMANSMPGLEAYLSRLDTALLRCTGEQPSGDQMTQIIFLNVQHLPEIRRDIEDYQHFDDSHPNRSYSWLRIACERALGQWRSTRHRADYVAAGRPGRGGAVP